LLVGAHTAAIDASAPRALSGEARAQTSPHHPTPRTCRTQRRPGRLRETGRTGRHRNPSPAPRCYRAPFG